MVKKPMSGYCASFPVFGGSVYVYVSGQESGEGGRGCTCEGREVEE